MKDYAVKSTSSRKQQVSLQDAVKLVTEAVNLDNNKNFEAAYATYSKAIDAFAAAVDSGHVNKATISTVVQRMQGYVARLYVLEKAVQKRKTNIGPALMIMATHGFNPLPAAEQLYLSARLSDSKGDKAGALREYTQGLEYFMGFHHACKARKAKTPPEVVQKITKMLDRAEALKSAK